MLDCNRALAAILIIIFSQVNSFPANPSFASFDQTFFTTNGLTIGMRIGTPNFIPFWDGTFTGDSGLYSITETRLGFGAQYTNSFLSNTGTQNTWLGNNAGSSITTASQSVGIGFGTLDAVTSGVRNSGFGALSLTSLTTGNNNTSGGYQSLQNLTSGSQMTAYGAGSFLSATTAGEGTAMGFNAATSLTSGVQGSFFGQAAGQSITTANAASLFGYQAGTQHTTDRGPTYFGAGAGQSALNGAESAIFGYTQWSNPTNITKSVAVGGRPLPIGDPLTNTVANSIVIGYTEAGTTNAVTGYTNIIAIAHDLVVTNNNEMFLGNSTNTLVRLARDRALHWGTGSPESAVTANTGSLYLRDDGSTATSLYIKTANDSANTGWTAVDPSGGGGGSLADPSGLIGMTMVPGVALTGTRSDGRHALDPDIDPDWGGQHTMLNRGIFFGPNAEAWWGSELNDGTVAVAYSNVAIGDPNNRTIYSWIEDGTTTSEFELTHTKTYSLMQVRLPSVNEKVEMIVDANGPALLLDVNNVTRTWFRPKMVDAADAVVYDFDTANFLDDAGAQLARFRNFGTNKVVISHTGAINILNSAITANEPFFAVTNTWNNAGVTFTGIKLSTVSSASAAASLLMDWDVGGTGQFKITKAGNVGSAGGFSRYAAPTLGMFFAAGTLQLQNDAGTVVFGSGNATGSGVAVFPTGIAWGANYFTPDIFALREGAAILQLGVDAATATTQTLKAHDGSGTDKSGADFVTNGGQSTGTGVGGSRIERTSLTGSTGAALNSYSTRSYVYAGEKTLTESSATIVLNIALGSSKYIGGRLLATTHADDATDFQAITDQFYFSAVNKAGTVTATITAVPLTSTTAASAGTLATTWTAVANAATVDLKNSAVSSLTQTTLKVKWQLELNSDDVGTVTP